VGSAVVLSDLLLRCVRSLMTHKRHQRARNPAVQRKCLRRVPRPHSADEEKNDQPPVVREPEPTAPAQAFWRLRMKFKGDYSDGKGRIVGSLRLADGEHRVA
jgi:hypothetical protein